MKHGHRYNQFLKIYKSELIHHRLTYIALSRVGEKENLYLLAPLVEANFKVDKFVSNEMQRLKTTAQWQLCVPYLQHFRQTHTIIQSLNTRFQSLHFQNIETDHNLQTSHILCSNETKVKTQINLHINIQIIQNTNQLLHTKAKEPCYCMIEVLYLIHVNL